VARASANLAVKPCFFKVFDRRCIVARPNKIWFRKDTNWWMVTLDGKKMRLAEGRANRKLAEQKFHELKVVQARPAQSSDARVADIIDAFFILVAYPPQR
jgi:hypothetical protein